MRLYLDDSIKSSEDYTSTYQKLATLKARITTTDISVDDKTLKRCIQSHSPFTSQEVEDEFEGPSGEDSIGSMAFAPTSRCSKKVLDHMQGYEIAYAPKIFGAYARTMCFLYCI